MDTPTRWRPPRLWRSAQLLARAQQLGVQLVTLDELLATVRDEGEQAGIETLGMRVLVTQSVMRDAEDRARLASETLEFSAGLVAR